VDVEVLGSGPKRVVRLYIDKPGGVSHADCELISQQAGTVFDVEDIIPGGSYTLEVSSPGLERKLKHEKDFVRFAGSQARLLLRTPLNGRKRWEGVLRGFEDGAVLFEPALGEILRVDLTSIEKANLKFEW
jgi:ribosome maturation factor RimP